MLNKIPSSKEVPDPNCRYCRGRGWVMVRCGPDDVEKDPCDCLHEETRTKLQIIIDDVVAKLKGDAYDH